MSQRIVVCDDDRHIVLAVTMKLSKAGFKIESASDGQGAWELIERERPDLIITDCQMPRLNGLELCQKLWEHPEMHGIPVFMLTAKGLELDAEELRRDLGVHRVIMKPFSPRDLLQLVEETLALSPVLS